MNGIRITGESVLYQLFGELVGGEYNREQS